MVADVFRDNCHVGATHIDTNLRLIVVFLLKS